MGKRPKLPFFFDHFSKSQEQNVEQQHQIIIENIDDVYRPISQSLKEFKHERKITDKLLYQVYIRSTALESLKQHLKSNTRVEQGGILYGHAYQDPSSENIYVEITAAIAAPVTIGSGAHLEYTSNSWLKIMDYASKKHPNENIVGSYHSHPNIGVFMSGTDMKTQRAFFYHPWSLSIVYDPIREEIGYFLGKDAKKVEPFIYMPEKQQPLKDEQQLSIISPVQQPAKLQRNKSEIPVWLLSIPLSFCAGFWAANHFINTSLTDPNNNNLQTSSSSNPPIFQAYIKSMPITEFKTMNEINPQYLRYSLSNRDNKITQGAMVKTLILLQNGTEAINNLTLKYDEIKLFSDQEINDNSSIFLADIKGKTESKTMLLNFQTYKQDGIMFFMYGYSHKTNNQRIYKGDTIYVPRSITYLDNSNKKQETNFQNYMRGEDD